MRSKTYIATPPGETIKEQLLDRAMSQKEFAVRMNMSEKHISKLINGEVQLTTDMALRLEMVLGLPAHFWTNLENIYREKLAKVQAENDLMEDIIIAKKFPYNEMAKYKWVPDEKKIENRVFNLRKYFEVVKLSLLKDDCLSGISFRRLGESEKGDYALIAWSQKAKLEARKIVVSSINIDKLKKKLTIIRKMTQLEPSIFCSQLSEILAECGIAIVFLPSIGGSYLHGATFYDGSKIVLGMTVRGKDADRFWFSLFHELGHIILGHLNNTNANDEIEADIFARDTLISMADWQNFIDKKLYNKSNIVTFSNEEEIAPSIVLGRLQKEHYVSFSSFNELKAKYEINE